MKKIFVLSFFLSACTVQRSNMPNHLLISDKPTTVSKETLRMVIGSMYYDVVAPENVIVLKQNVYTKLGWKEALVVYYQHKIGTFWRAVDSFPLEGEYLQIQRTERLKYDSLVTWITICKDLIVTRSFVLKYGIWTPR